MQTATARITVESPDFNDGQTIPREYTADGRNVSPPLKWRDVPEGNYIDRHISPSCARSG